MPSRDLLASSASATRSIPPDAARRPCGEATSGPPTPSSTARTSTRCSCCVHCYEGQVDCIYIDPPYNTGARDWKYNNDYVDGNDRWRHSKWLSMMEKRLRLAKRLLKPDGVLIVTIDENEVHHLGVLLERALPGVPALHGHDRHQPARARRRPTSRGSRSTRIFCVPNRCSDAHPTARRSDDAADDERRRRGPTSEDSTTSEASQVDDDLAESRRAAIVSVLDLRRRGAESCARDRRRHVLRRSTSTSEEQHGRHGRAAHPALDEEPDVEHASTGCGPSSRSTERQRARWRYGPRHDADAASTPARSRRAATTRQPTPRRINHWQSRSARRDVHSSQKLQDGLVATPATTPARTARRCSPASSARRNRSRSRSRSTRSRDCLGCRRAGTARTR